jgi:hypothetical protein
MKNKKVMTLLILPTVVRGLFHIFLSLKNINFSKLYFLKFLYCCRTRATKQDRNSKPSPDAQTMAKAANHDYSRKPWPKPQNMAKAANHGQSRKPWPKLQPMAEAANHSQCRKLWSKPQTMAGATNCAGAAN